MTANLSPRMVTTDLVQVFISYWWRDEVLVSPILADLAALGFDVTSSGGRPDAKTMAEGIETSSVVILILSADYINSKSCQSEAWYAYEQRKPIVGVKAEKNIRVEEWLEPMFRSVSNQLVELTPAKNQLVKNEAKNLQLYHGFFNKLVAEIDKQAIVAQDIAENIRIKTHPILEAARLGDVAQIQAIIRREGDHLLDTHHADAIGDMPIHRAARFGRTEAMRSLVALGSGVQLRNKLGATAVHLAALMGHVGAVEYLVNEADASVKERDSMMWLPIHLASAGGHVEVAGIILDKDPTQVEAQTGEEDLCSTPLMEAARNGKIEIAKLLVERGAVAEAKNLKGNNALHLAAINDFAQMAEFLVEDVGLNIEERGQFGRTPLLTACAHGSRNVAQVLLEQGAYLFACSEAASDNASSAIHLAAAAGSGEILDMIFRFMFEGRDFQGRTPLHRAAINGELDSAAFLCAHASREVLRGKDGHNKTPLDLAMEAEKLERHQSAEVVKLLKDCSK